MNRHVDIMRLLDWDFWGWNYRRRKTINYTLANSIISHIRIKFLGMGEKYKDRIRNVIKLCGECLNFKNQYSKGHTAPQNTCWLQTLLFHPITEAILKVLFLQSLWEVWREVQWILLPSAVPWKYRLRKMSVCPYPPHLPDHRPCDFCFFPEVKITMKGKHSELIQTSRKLWEGSWRHSWSKTSWTATKSGN